MQAWLTLNKLKTVLAVDIGNSEIKIARIENGTINEPLRGATLDYVKLADEIASRNLPVLLASVRSKEAAAVKEAIHACQQKILLDLDWTVRSPVSGFYEGIGADRIASVCAAYLSFEGKRPVASVSFGTATTITAATREGRFAGGYITLGLNAACMALQKDLPELPAISPQEPDSLEPAFNTHSAIMRGTINAQIGAVKEWIELIKQSLGEDLAVLATGGQAELLASKCPQVDKIEKNLTFRGLWEIYLAQYR